MNKNFSTVITAIILLSMLIGSASAVPSDHWNRRFGEIKEELTRSVQQTSDGDYIHADSINGPPYPPVPKRKVDNILGIIGLLVVPILGWFALSRIRGNKFLRAGAFLLVISFGLFMLFLATAEGDYGMIWILFTSPIIFISALILLIAGMQSKRPKKAIE